LWLPENSVPKKSIIPRIFTLAKELGILSKIQKILKSVRKKPQRKIKILVSKAIGFLCEMSMFTCEKIAMLESELQKAREDHATEKSKLEARIAQLERDLQQAQEDHAKEIEELNKKAVGHVQLASTPVSSAYATGYSLSCSAQARRFSLWF
jgi:cell division protein FtsB